MVETKSSLAALRAQLNADDPAWQDRLRAELDALTPGWASFPLLIWDHEKRDWITVTLLANPEPVTPSTGGLWTRVRRWFKKA